MASDDRRLTPTLGKIFITVFSVVTIASEPVSIDYDRSFEKNRDVDVDVDSMLHGHVD